MPPKLQPSAYPASFSALWSGLTISIEAVSQKYKKKSINAKHNPPHKFNLTSFVHELPPNCKHVSGRSFFVVVVWSICIWYSSTGRGKRLPCAVCGLPLVQFSILQFPPLRRHAPNRNGLEVFHGTKIEPARRAQGAKRWEERRKGKDEYKTESLHSKHFPITAQPNNMSWHGKQFSGARKVYNW